MAIAAEFQARRTPARPRGTVRQGGTRERDAARAGVAARAARARQGERAGGSKWRATERRGQAACSDDECSAGGAQRGAAKGSGRRVRRRRARCSEIQRVAGHARTDSCCEKFDIR